MAVARRHPFRFPLGFVALVVTALAGLTLGADLATADPTPTPTPPLYTPPVPPGVITPGGTEPPVEGVLPPKTSTKPTTKPSTSGESDASKSKIASGEKTKKQKEEEKKKAAEKEEEELQNDKGKGACRHGFGSSITNKLSVSCMTEQAVDKIFGLPDGFGTQKLLRGLLKVPDFVGDSPAEGVSNAEWLTESIAFALLMAVVTFALFHYFAAGMLSGGGSGMFVDGVTRCVGAALLILAWPFIFENVANITNVITSTLIPESSIDGGIGMLANAAEAGGTLGAGLLVMIVFAVLMLILLMVKIGLLTGLMIAFVGMPLALALWPIPSLSGPATYAIRFVGMVFTVVILWAVSLRVFGAVSSEFRVWGGHNLGVGGKLLLPLVGLGALMALLSIPRHAVQMWNVAPQRGTVGSMFQYAASSMIASSVRGRGKGASGSRKVGGGQSKPGGGRPGGSTGGTGASGGGGNSGGQAGGGAPAPAVPTSAQSGQAGSGPGGSQSKGGGSGPGRNPRRGGSAPAPKKGSAGGGVGSPRRQLSQRRRQGSSGKPGGGQGAARAPAGAGGGRTGAAPRPQGGGGGGGTGTGGGKPTPARGTPARGTPSRGTSGGGANPARTSPRPPNPGGGSAPPGGGQPPRPGPTSHQSPPPPTK